MVENMLCFLFLQDGVTVGLITGFIALVVGFSVGFFVKYILVKTKIGNANNLAQTIVE